MYSVLHMMDRLEGKHSDVPDMTLVFTPAAQNHDGGDD